MKVRAMITTPGVSSFMLGGQTYSPNDDGIFFIPESHVIAAIRHGFTLVDSTEEGLTTTSTYSARATEKSFSDPSSTNMNVELTDKNIALALEDAQKEVEKSTKKDRKGK